MFFSAERFTDWRQSLTGDNVDQSHNLGSVGRLAVVAARVTGRCVLDKQRRAGRVAMVARLDRHSIPHFRAAAAAAADLPTAAAIVHKLQDGGQRQHITLRKQCVGYNIFVNILNRCVHTRSVITFIPHEKMFLQRF